MFPTPIIACLFFLWDCVEVLEVSFSVVVLLTAVEPSSATTATLFQFLKVPGSLDAWLFTYCSIKNQQKFADSGTTRHSQLTKHLFMSSLHCSWERLMTSYQRRVNDLKQDTDSMFGPKTLHPKWEIHGNPKSVQTNEGIIKQIRIWPLPPTFIQNNYRLIILLLMLHSLPAFLSCSWISKQIGKLNKHMNT